MGMESKESRLPEERFISADELEKSQNATIAKPTIVSFVSRKKRRCTPIFRKMTVTQWGFLALQAALLLLIAGAGINAMQLLRRSAQHISNFQPLPGTAGKKVLTLQNHIKPYVDYQNIWQRNLFGTYGTQKTENIENTSLDTAPPLASKALGLELIGTVVTDNSVLNLAVIENKKKRNYEILNEGDQIGDLRIKTILRNRVTIVTNTGEVLMAMGNGRPGTAGVWKNAEHAVADASDPGIANSRKFKVEIVKDGVAGSKYSTENAKFAQSLESPEQMARVHFLPFQDNLYADGIEVRVPTRHVLTHLGLRSRDVIKRINGKPVTKPSQAFDAFRSLASGGDLEVEVLRSGVPVNITVNSS